MLMWRSTSFRSACSYGACMGVNANTNIECTHTAEQWNQTDTFCWDNTYITVCKKGLPLLWISVNAVTYCIYTHTHTHVPTLHSMMLAPCVWPSAALLFFLFTALEKRNMVDPTGICQHFHPTAWHLHCNTLFHNAKYMASQNPGQTWWALCSNN